MSPYADEGPAALDREARAWQFASYQRHDLLALEMSLHESTERAALEGELHALEDAWKEAEEIAAIADNLLVPQGVATRLRKLRGD